MSGAVPVAEDAARLHTLTHSTHGGADGMSVRQSGNPMARVRRPVVAADPVSDGIRPSQLGFPDAEPATKGWFSRAGAKVSGALSWARGKVGDLASSAKRGVMSLPGLLSRGFQGTRSAIKSNGADYAEAADAVAEQTVDRAADWTAGLGRTKFDPKVDTHSLGWKSRAKGPDGKMVLTDAHEQRMFDAVDKGHADVKELLHDSASGLSDDQRADMVRKHLLANHKLKQRGKGGVYDKHVAAARAAEGTTDAARAGQVTAEASEGVIRAASSLPVKIASDLGTAVTGVSVANVAKHGAMVAKVAGQSALENDPQRQDRAKTAAERNADASRALATSLHDYRGARSAWAGQKDDDLSDEVKEQRSAHLAANNKALYAKLEANKEHLIASKAAGQNGQLDEYKLKHTQQVDKKTEQVVPRTPGMLPTPGVHPQYGMPMGTDTAVGRAGQGMHSAGESLAFMGKVATGSGAQKYLDSGEHAKALAVSGGALTVEAASAVGTGLAPGVGGLSVKALAKGSGYGAMGVGKGVSELGKKLASKQEQHDRYTDVMSGQRADDAAAHPIDFQGARSNHDPGGFTGLQEKSRDALADLSKRYARRALGGKSSV